MGVSGSGKSLIGSRLARALGLEFVEGDTYQSPENVARMSAGIPLTDGIARPGWLRLRRARHCATRGCRARGLLLGAERSYRDVLRAGSGDIQFVYLEGDRPLIEQRLADRRGHFMPSSLLDSQFATLEPPSADEDAWVATSVSRPM